MRGGSAATASCSVSKTTSPVAMWPSSGTVAYRASATNPSVPSEPTSRWVSRSAGVVWSRKALTA